MFHIHTTPKEFKIVTISGHFEFVFEKILEQGNHDYRDHIVFKNLPFQNVFRPHENERSAFPEFVWFNERFRKRSAVFETD